MHTICMDVMEFLSLVGNGSYGRGKPFYPRWVMEGEGEAFLSLVGNGSYGRGKLSILGG